MCSSCEGEVEVFNLHWLPEAGENCGCALAVFEGVSLANRVLRASKVETAAGSDREQRRIFRLRTYDCASAAATSIPPDQFAAPVRRTTTTVSRRLLHNALGLPQVVSPWRSVCLRKSSCCKLIFVACQGRTGAAAGDATRDWERQLRTEHSRKPSRTKTEEPSRW
eukprot:COSAG01_NODE_5941_length_3941_cov_6.953930_5_plen_166_part_00